ncbi:MAG TPA: hypothetical protein VKQ72_02440, partial [Aggregatilineales bacterium]|nr:hypothetical protein [Aggregatilineales bacterium]
IVRNGCPILGCIENMPIYQTYRTAENRPEVLLSEGTGFQADAADGGMSVTIGTNKGFYTEIGNKRTLNWVRDGTAIMLTATSDLSKDDLIELALTFREVSKSF